MSFGFQATAFAGRMLLTGFIRCTFILAYPRSTIAFGPVSTHRCANPSYESHTENVHANTKDEPSGCGSVLSILYDMQMTYRLAASRKYVTNIFRGTQTHTTL